MDTSWAMYELLLLYNITTIEIQKVFAREKYIIVIDTPCQAVTG